MPSKLLDVAEGFDAAIVRAWKVSLLEVKNFLVAAEVGGLPVRASTSRVVAHERFLPMSLLMLLQLLFDEELAADVAHVVLLLDGPACFVDDVLEHRRVVDEAAAIRVVLILQVRRCVSSQEQFAVEGLAARTFERLVVHDVNGLLVQVELVPGAEELGADVAGKVPHAECPRDVLADVTLHAVLAVEAHFANIAFERPVVVVDASLVPRDRLCYQKFAAQVARRHG